LRDHTAAAGNEVAGARAELARLDAGEFSSSLGLETHESLTRRVQQALDPRSVLISFHLGDSGSWMWALDHSTLTLRSLPPRRQIEEQMRAATHAIQEDLPDSARLSARLYQTLFGSLEPRSRQKSRWLLALESTLFDVPLAALVIDASGHQPVFVAERHDTVVIPGAGYWLQTALRRRPQPPSLTFVGIGDAIYNTADPRLPTARPASVFRARYLKASAATSLPSLALPRLVASGAELDTCARAWRGQEVLLKGPEASRDRLEEQIRRNPCVLHFATHFLPSPGGHTSGLIVLSLNRQGETELLSPEEIAHWKVDTTLVVLSGCRSAEGAILPGTGLLGLTRAWLAAGAHTVIGSHWNAPDDSGIFFSVLYRILRQQAQPDAPEALRAAQVEMLRAGGWRARPRFWGTYLAVGN